LRSAIKRSEDSLDFAAQRLSDLEIANAGRKMSADDWATRGSLVAQIRKNEQDLTTLTDVAKRKATRAKGITSLHERATFEKRDGRYFQTVAAAAVGDPGAQELLERHGREMASAAPKQMEAALRSHYRHTEDRQRFEQEVRTGMTSGSGSAGSFVTPTYINELWASYLSPYRTVINQTNQQPLPEYGLQVNIPAVTSAAAVGTQIAENAGVDDIDFDGDLLSCTLVACAGNLTVSQQLWDRTSGNFDQFAVGQMREQYDAAADAVVLASMLAGAGSITNADTGATEADVIASFYADVAAASRAIHTTPGLRLSPTHVFATSNEWTFVSSLTDTEGRPLITPDSAALVAAASDPQWRGWTGIHLASGLSVWRDDSIPTVSAGAGTQILVSAPQTVAVFESDTPLTFAWPNGVAATSLGVDIGLRGYVGAIPTRPLATQAITGARYPVDPSVVQE